MRTQTKKLTILAMLSAIAYFATMFGRIPVVLFLKYDPSDVIITIGGFIYGPLAALAMSIIISFVEMLTLSSTGIIGAIMNIISTCSFACTAAFIYKKKRNIKRAIIGLLVGLFFMTAVMLLWNYFIAPIYMGLPRKAVKELLLPAFLPFNLLKGSLNAAIAMILYKPITITLRKSNMMPMVEKTEVKTTKVNIGIILVSSFVIITCILLILILYEPL